MFMRCTGYVAILRELTGLFAQSCEKRLVCIDGSVPAFCLNYFKEVSKKRAALGDELWLHGFVTSFLGELIFSHGWMTVAIEVAEIALAVVTRQIDLTPVVLAETYRGVDCISHRCRHFHGCRALVQVWLAGHLEINILRTQRQAFETYRNSSHASTIKSVRKEYEKLSKLTDDAVTWHIISSTAEPFTVFFGPHDMRLVVLLGFSEGVEYHPIWVMRQFSLQQGAFVDSTAPRLLQPYPLNSIAATAELADLM